MNKVKMVYGFLCGVGGILIVSVPTRYLHSASCVCAISDIEAAADLCEAILRRMDTERP